MPKWKNLTMALKKPCSILSTAMESVILQLNKNVSDFHWNFKFKKWLRLSKNICVLLLFTLLFVEKNLKSAFAAS